MTGPKPTQVELAELRERLGELFEHLTLAEQMMLYRGRHVIAAMPRDHQAALAKFIAQLINARRSPN